MGGREGGAEPGQSQVDESAARPGVSWLSGGGNGMSVPEQRGRGTGNRRLPPLVVRFGKSQATQPLTSTQHLVALTLSLYAGADGGGTHPGVPRLAEATSLAERTVTAALRALVTGSCVMGT